MSSQFDDIPALSRGDALFLDFDGTLAPLQDNPDTVFLPEGLSDVLVNLNSALETALAVISGRGLEDIAKRVPDSVWRFGNHGLFHASPNEKAATPVVDLPDALVNSLDRSLAEYQGVRMELKGPVVAVHYRAAPTVENALAKVLEDIVADLSGYKLQNGKYVFELKPLAANKGRALEAAMQMEPFKGRRPVMIGDDTTDEDAFEAANRLEGVSIKVGAGASLASHRLSDVQAVHAYLRRGI